MRGVYVHIPFCSSICSYCDFCKMQYNSKYVSEYLEALDKEIKENYKGDIVKSIFIGGGTPSALDIDELDKLLSILSKIRLDEDYEYTIECNIESIDIDKINLFKSYGINRISVGVESMDEGIIKILGRYHDEDMVFDNIYMLKKYFDNINIDLIYAVTEDINVVKRDIQKFLELDIPHVSCYSLILEDNTKLKIEGYKNISEDVDKEMFDYINDTLVKNGYNHYEISNYARDGYESMHNKNYWNNGEYYGFGLGAVGYINHVRINNTKNFKKYLNGEYVASLEQENEKVRKENDLILGFRLIRGIMIEEFNRKYQDNLLEKEVIKNLICDGYLEIDKGYLRVKHEYIYLQNMILEKIMDSDL